MTRTEFLKAYAPSNPAKVQYEYRVVEWREDGRYHDAPILATYQQERAALRRADAMVAAGEMVVVRSFEVR